jgi:hypothetical protein
MAVKKITKVKIQKPRKTRAAINAVDLRYNGTEPFDVSVKGYVHALNWYNYEYDVDQARKWLFEYLNKNGFKKTDIASIRRCPKYSVPTTVGWQARMIMNGNTLEDRSMAYFKGHIDRLIAEGLTVKQETEVVVEKPVVSIQERTLAKNNMILDGAEEIVDAFESMYGYLQSVEATPSAAAFIRDRYQAIYDELMDDDVAAELFDKKRLKIERTYWQTVMDDLDRYIGNKKATKVRKPRQKKQKSAVDLVSKLQYQKEYSPLKIVSVNPADIIGAQQLWAYNTKYRKLTQYVASGPNGLQVNKATFEGYDVETSATKRVRKPEDAIKAVLSAGKVSLRRIMEDIKTQAEPAKSRINNDTILLRVIK